MRFTDKEDQFIKDNLALSNVELSIKLNKHASQIRDRKSYLRKQGFLPEYKSQSKINLELKTKNCTRCKENKEFEEFYKSSINPDGLKCYCKSCTKEINKPYEKLRWEIKKEEIKSDPILKSDLAIKGRIWRTKNKERLSESKTKYYHENKERILKYSTDYHRLRKLEDNNFRLRCNTRKRVYDAVRGICYSSQTQAIFGCSRDEFLNYLESKFYGGMNWDNYGNNGIWEVDHIIPISNYDLTDLSQLRLALHYTNCQPLLIKENRSKFNKVNQDNAFMLV